MIEHILIIAFFTLGYCCTFWEGMIFQRIGDWMECNMPQWLWKPIGGCYICACMWVGSIVYWTMFYDKTKFAPLTTGERLLDWFITCVGAMGINAAISQFVDKRHEVEIVNDDDEQEKEYYAD